MPVCGGRIDLRRPLSGLWVEQDLGASKQGDDLARVLVSDGRIPELRAAPAISSFEFGFYRDRSVRFIERWRPDSTSSRGRQRAIRSHRRLQEQLVG